MSERGQDPARANAAIYHRVSRGDQDSTLARDELRMAATARGMAVALEVEETGSGARNDRPGLARVLDAARRGRIRAVIVWKLDRFGRSALDVLTNIRALRDCGCRFIVSSQGLDVRPDGDAVSSLILNILASVAEFERELIVERTMLGLDKARRAGKQLGRPELPLPDLARVEQLHRQKMGYRKIAAVLGCSEGQARRALAALDRKAGP